MRVRELNNWLKLLELLGHDVDVKWYKTDEGKTGRRYTIDKAYYVEVVAGNVRMPKSVVGDE